MSRWHCTPCFGACTPGLAGISITSWSSWIVKFGCLHALSHSCYDLLYCSASWSMHMPWWCGCIRTTIQNDLHIQWQAGGQRFCISLISPVTAACIHAGVWNILPGGQLAAKLPSAQELQPSSEEVGLDLQQSFSVRICHRHFHWKFQSLCLALLTGRGPVLVLQTGTDHHAADWQALYPGCQWC